MAPTRYQSRRQFRKSQCAKFVRSLQHIFGNGLAYRHNVRLILHVQNDIDDAWIAAGVADASQFLGSHKFQSRIFHDQISAPNPSHELYDRVAQQKWLDAQ